MSTGLRIWVPAAALAVVAALAGGWVVGVQPQVAEAATSDSNAAAVETSNGVARTRLVHLAKLAATLDAMKAQDAVLQQAVPTFVNSSRFVRRVNAVAALNGVTVRSIVPAPASAYLPPASPAAGASSVGAVFGRTAPGISAANFTVVPMSVDVSGTADGVLAFTQAMQNDQRLFPISSLSTTANSDGTVDASLGGVIYTLKR